MRKKIFNYIPGSMLLLAAYIFAAPACTKVMPDKPRYDEDSTRQQFGNVKLKKKKILLIGIDGAVSQITRDLNPPVIKDLLPSSIYTFNGLADTVTSVATGWATMTTGVSYLNHQIKDSSLIPSTVKGSHADIKYYDNFISIIKADDIATRVTVITTWDDMTSFLLNTADNVINTSPAKGDAGVEEAAVASLSNANADILLVNFSAPAATGQANGFSANNTAYTKSILDTDARIGKLLTAMKGRKTFADEDWLVIIQSTGGGSGSTLGGRTVVARNTFSIYYSPRLVSQEVVNKIMPNDYAVRLYGGPNNNVRAENADGGLYNIGNGALTVEAKVKLNKNPATNNYNYSFPPFISKTAARSGTTAGWSMFRNGDKISWYVAEGNKKAEVPTTKAISDGNWHVMTGVAYKQGSEYVATFYLDGENKVTATTVGATATAVSNAPFTIGYNENPFGTQYIDMYVADVRVWNVALSDDDIKNWAYATGDLSKHPKYANLIGYWSCMDGNGGTFADMSPSQKNFTLKGNYAWDFMGDFFTPPSNTPPTLIDVVPAIYYWMGITLEGNKKPVGKNWLTLKIQ